MLTYKIYLLGEDQEDPIFVKGTRVQMQDAREHLRSISVDRATGRRRAERPETG